MSDRLQQLRHVARQLAKARPRLQPRHEGPVTLSSDCSGYASCLQAMLHLGVAVQPIVSSEACPQKRMLLGAVRACLSGAAPSAMLHDLRDRRKERADSTRCCDLHEGGYPCVSWSRAGKQLGFCDARGSLLLHGLESILHEGPRCFVLENVAPWTPCFASLRKSWWKAATPPPGRSSTPPSKGCQNRQRLYWIGARCDLPLHLDCNKEGPRKQVGRGARAAFAPQRRQPLAEIWPEPLPAPRLLKLTIVGSETGRGRNGAYRANLKQAGAAAIHC